MTTTSPWAPQAGSGSQGPVGPPQSSMPAPPAGGPPGSPTQQTPPRPGPRRSVWIWLASGAVLLMIVAVAATAAITYAIARDTTTPSAAQPNPTPTAPQFTASQQADAKQHLCNVFDASARGQKGQGGVVVNGEVNLPLVVRSVNSAVAVQNALAPAVPGDVGTAARTYIDTSLELTTAATGNASLDEVNRLTTSSNDATYALADACGLR